MPEHTVAGYRLGERIGMVDVARDFLKDLPDTVPKEHYRDRLMFLEVLHVRGFTRLYGHAAGLRVTEDAVLNLAAEERIKQALTRHEFFGAALHCHNLGFTGGGGDHVLGLTSPG